MEQSSFTVALGVIGKFVLIGVGVATGVGAVVVVFLLAALLIRGMKAKIVSFRDKVKAEAARLKAQGNPGWQGGAG